ncbi:UNVERIFIED_CONTAM: hypothetical protein HHA_268700 [Hammondia hammondi]|eukprot:XP_008882260.1 hypothetical protein HHA_268700 [Hammondia hammondi]
MRRDYANICGFVRDPINSLSSRWGKRLCAASSRQEGPSHYKFCDHQNISPGNHVKQDKIAAQRFRAMVGRIRSATPLTVNSPRQVQKASDNHNGESRATSTKAAARIRKSPEFKHSGLQNATVPQFRKARFAQAPAIAPKSGLEISARRVRRHKLPPKTMGDLEDEEIAAELGSNVTRRKHIAAPEFEYAAPGAEEVLSAPASPRPSAVPSPATVAPSEADLQGGLVINVITGQAPQPAAVEAQPTSAAMPEAMPMPETPPPSPEVPDRAAEQGPVSFAPPSPADLTPIVEAIRQLEGKVSLAAPVAPAIAPQQAVSVADPVAVPVNIENNNCCCGGDCSNST